MKTEDIKTMIEDYENLPLECDGMTRVIHYLLKQNKVKHQVYYGRVVYKDKSFYPHYWIELPDKTMIDYKAKMWLGEGAVNGIFKLKNELDMKYIGEKTKLLVNDIIFLILTGGIWWTFWILV